MGIRMLISSGDMSVSTAKRVMGTVISFYRWISEEDLMSLGNEHWKESDKYVEFKNNQGFSVSKLVKSTDLNISIKTQKTHMTKQLRMVESCVH